MATSEQIRFLHDATDKLREDADRAFADLSPSVEMRVVRHGEPRRLFRKIVRLEGYLGQSHELTKQNIQGSLEQYGIVNVLRPREFWFGLGYYGSEVLHFLETHDGTLVIVPSAPLEFSQLLRAVRRQIESGDAVQPEAQDAALPSRTGCVFAALVLGTGAIGLHYLGHLVGLV